VADVGQVLATGGTALVSAAAGAGLTYWLGALNRRHQEAREDKTRWYEARREAYGAFLIATSRASTPWGDAVFRDAAEKPGRPMGEPTDELTAAMGAVHLVGSPPVIEAADNLFTAILEDLASAVQEVSELARRQVEQGEVTNEDLDLMEEALENFSRARPIHTPLARAAFEEVARKDLGHLDPPTSKGHGERPGRPTTEKAEGEADTNQPDAPG
jgi:hypothetical protein